MNVGIKYCGGCNPRFNRREFVERLIDENKYSSFEPATENNFYDVILVVCGCTSKCAKHDNLNSSKKLIITSQNDYSKVTKYLHQRIIDDTKSKV